jgi:hypothetical protein
VVLISGEPGIGKSRRQLGGDRGTRLTAKQRALGRAALQAKAPRLRNESVLARTRR